MIEFDKKEEREKRYVFPWENAGQRDMHSIYHPPYSSDPYHPDPYAG